MPEAFPAISDIRRDILSAIDLSGFCAAMRLAVNSILPQAVAIRTIVPTGAEPDWPNKGIAGLLSQNHCCGPIVIPAEKPLLAIPYFQDLHLLGYTLANLPGMLEESELNRVSEELQRILDAACATLARIAYQTELQMLAAQLSLAFDAGSRLLSIHNTKEILQQISQIAVDELKFCAAAVATPGTVPEEVIVQASHGMTRLALGLVLPLADCMPFRKALSEHCLQLFSETEAQTCLPGLMQNLSGLAVPLTLENEALALLLVFRSSNGSPKLFHPDAIRVFARQAAHALEHARIYAEMERTAVTDPLTGAYNRHQFERALRREMARVRRYRHPISLLMIDVCDFKRVNDRFGHMAGDQILIKLAEVLRDNIRESDIVARFGGDEFVVLMPDTTERQARKVQTRINRAIEKHNRTAPPAEIFIISTGLKSMLDLNAEELIDEADRAMYLDKELRARRRLLEAILQQKIKEIEAIDYSLGSILSTLWEKEPDYPQHARKAMEYCVGIARVLALDEDFVEKLALGALLHDIGKAAIQESILNRSQPLTAEQYAIARSHAMLGYDLLSGVERLRPIRHIIRSHHERWDGRTEEPSAGYPDGLSGTMIPLGARILRVADLYDSLTRERPYRRAISPAKALAVLRKESGKALDPQMVQAFFIYLKKP